MKRDRFRSSWNSACASLFVAMVVSIPSALTDSSKTLLPSGSPPSVSRGRQSSSEQFEKLASGRLNPKTGKTTTATINVTTTEQKVSSSGGCSLQEAIYSANFDINQAISPSAMDLTSFITTECTPGNGDDTIVLQPGAVYQMGIIVNDPLNQLGPTATPLIFTNITIEANGATLELVPSAPNMRLFAVADLYTDITVNGHTIPAGTKGHLTVRNAYIKNFRVRGGNGAGGGGGGMGAGGAIYLKDGDLTVENCTFDSNSAVGGSGSSLSGTFDGGGGGGLTGNGGNPGSTGAFDGGGGGGGSRGNGGNGGSDGFCPDSGCPGGGGGGGGTLRDGQSVVPGIASGNGGFSCGAPGGNSIDLLGGDDGDDGQCPGGGGGGGASRRKFFLTSGDGGRGAYGGGGGGAGADGGDGGDGGFGGGGGGGSTVVGLGPPSGGKGGFGGGGGGAANPGDSGQFAGHGSSAGGGGGAGLGGAIFNDNGVATIVNSTFTGNRVAGGHSTVANDGQGLGGAIFSNNGALVVQNATISGNQSTSDHKDGGIAVFGGNLSPAVFGLFNTIVANNEMKEVSVSGSVTVVGAGDLIGDNDGGPPPVSTANPQLRPLQLNPPGNTPTMAIPSSSPAFNAGDDSNGNCAATDQRGVSRPQFAQCDIGAYEVDCIGFDITCPANKSQSNDPGQCGAVVTYPPPTVTGNCAPVCTPGSGSFFPIGTTNVFCSADLATCSFNVTVTDAQPPTITCPSNVTRINDPGQCGAVITYPAPGVADNCPGVNSPACVPPSGSFYPVGTNTVTCSAKDASNNMSSCSFTVTVRDSQPPVITCPPDIVATAAASCPIATSAPANFTVTAADNCPGVTVICRNQNNQIVTSGSPFPLGTSTVTCTATDISGNTAVCSFSVQLFSFCLQDETNPGNVVLVNAQTGDYKFCCAGVSIASGRGTLTTRACAGSINYAQSDRRVQIQWDTSANGVGAGTAIVQAGPNQTICQIVDKRMSPNICTCH